MYLATNYGLGDAAQASRNVQIIGSTTAGIATGILGTLGITAAAVPVIGAGLMAATMLVQYLVANSGCGQTCIITSEWANKAADALQQVLDAYFALPAPRTQAQKAVAVANFQAIWHQLEQACGQPGTGDAGKRCISDRQSGACVWHQAYDPTYPGQPKKGECWNWFNGYLKPIQDDPVVSDAVASSSFDLSAVGGSGSVDLLPLAIIGGLLALGVAL